MGISNMNRTYTESFHSVLKGRVAYSILFVGKETIERIYGRKKGIAVENRKINYMILLSVL